MENTWEIHEKYMGNTCDIHEKYISIMYFPCIPHVFTKLL